VTVELGQNRPVTDEDRARIRTAQDEAYELGYRLVIEDAPNLGLLRHMALAYSVMGTQPSMGRWLTYAPSAPEAAEAGVEILRGIVERDDPWPRED
jgi:hypothetical protein